MQIVQELETLISDQPKSPLRPQQVQEYEEELVRLGAVARGADQDGQARPWMPGDRGAARQSAQRIQKILAQQAPKPINDPKRKDEIARKTKDVLDTVIRPAMLTRAEMRRNPAGAVDHFIRRESAKPVKRAILTWKRAMRALEPTNDEPNYTNVERFRREGMPEGTSSFMAESQIPGVFAMSPQAKEQWPLGDPTATTALGQARAREAAGAEPKKKRVLTPEQRQVLVDRLATARAKKAATSV